MTLGHDVRRRAHVALLALVAGVATSGCVAAGLAAGPLMSAVQMVGDRSVERTAGTDIHEAWAALETALIRMAFRVEAREHEEAEWRLRGVADRVTVHARLERVTSRLTRVTLRVETGGLLADRRTADVIHDQIARSVAEAAAVTVSTPVGGAPSEALMSLEAEVRRLRTEMEDRRQAGRPPADRVAEPAPVMRVEPSAVVTVPLSAALPTIPGPVPPISVAQPVNGVTPAGAAVPIVGTTIAGDDSPAPFASARTAPLRPAAALVPIRPVSGPGGGK